MTVCTFRSVNLTLFLYKTIISSYQVIHSGLTANRAANILWMKQVMGLHTQSLLSFTLGKMLAHPQNFRIPSVQFITLLPQTIITKGWEAFLKRDRQQTFQFYRPNVFVSKTQICYCSSKAAKGSKETNGYAKSSIDSTYQNKYHLDLAHRPQLASSGLQTPLYHVVSHHMRNRHRENHSKCPKLHLNNFNLVSLYPQYLLEWIRYEN